MRAPPFSRGAALSRFGREAVRNSIGLLLLSPCDCCTLGTMPPPVPARRAERMAPTRDDTPALSIGPLTLPPSAVDFLVAHEGSPTKPYWPKSEYSGVTVGVGYDLGHHRPDEIVEDWSVLGRSAAEDLTRASGKYGKRAKAVLPTLRHVYVGPEAARSVLLKRSLPKYARQTAEAFPGVETLPPQAQGALLSLVYNRGPGMKGDSRREMREIRQAVAELTKGTMYEREALGRIAKSIRAMKRLWVGKNLPGLLRRRDEEADLVENAVHETEPVRLPDPVPVDVLAPEPLPARPWPFSAWRSVADALARLRGAR